MDKIYVVHERANKHLHKSTLVLYGADTQTGAFSNRELNGTPRIRSQQHGSVQGYRTQKAVACQTGR